MKFDSLLPTHLQFSRLYLIAKHNPLQLNESDKIIQSGTLIKPVPNGTNTIFYDVEARGGGGQWDMKGIVIFFNNNTQFDAPIFYSFIRISDNDLQTCIPKTAANSGVAADSCLADVLSLLLFLHHCELETKVIPAGKKSTHVNKKYLNETKSPIEVLDSTYFTTIVRSAGFTVGEDTGGFFRYQAYGPNMQYRKWIWIFPFEKEGYERQAKILRQ